MPDTTPTLTSTIRVRSHGDSVTLEELFDHLICEGLSLLEENLTRKVAIIWYDECLLRYSNHSFFSIMDEEPSFILLNSQNNSNPGKFNKLGKLATEVVSSASKFTTLETNYTSFQTLYCLAQCTPDLSGNDCNQCLRDAISLFPICCSGAVGARVVRPSCNVRYEVYPFYRITASVPAPSPIPLSLPAPSNRTVASVGDGSRNAEALQFNLSTVAAATNNFSDANKIGEGGFGSAYKGKFPNGQEIAVKRLSKNSGQGAVEFKNEVMLVAKLQHRNLVRLLGFRLEGEEKILIYMSMLSTKASTTSYLVLMNMHAWIGQPVTRS
uniref:Cysteine-rich receptor-like protein kinase 25 n=1 Tax=Nelumbo nucifera TaxID=4432 RepID=A0A822XNQ0_NELNU|nr:TPA_asm: hypothetical protein HUJ06_024697 [Nelumbo nucifera]